MIVDIDYNDCTIFWHHIHIEAMWLSLNCTCWPGQIKSQRISRNILWFLLQLNLAAYVSLWHGLSIARRPHLLMHSIIQLQISFWYCRLQSAGLLASCHQVSSVSPTSIATSSAGLNILSLSQFCFCYANWDIRCGFWISYVRKN